MTINHVKCKRLLCGEMFPINEVQEADDRGDDEVSSAADGGESTSRSAREATLPSASPLSPRPDKTWPYRHDNENEDESDNNTITITNSRSIPLGDGGGGGGTISSLHSSPNTAKNSLSYPRDDSFRCQTIVSLEEFSQGSDVSKEDGERDGNRGMMYYFHRTASMSSSSLQCSFRALFASSPSLFDPDADADNINEDDILSKKAEEPVSLLQFLASWLWLDNNQNAMKKSSISSNDKNNLVLYVSIIGTFAVLSFSTSTTSSLSTTTLYHSDRELPRLLSLLLAAREVIFNLYEYVRSLPFPVKQSTCYYWLAVLIASATASTASLPLVRAMAENLCYSVPEWILVLGSISDTISTCIVKKRAPRELRPELKAKVKRWLISFHRLDPRYKILKFFNQVASEGADNLVDKDEYVDDYPTDMECFYNGQLEPSSNELDSFSSEEFQKKNSLLTDTFDVTSVLTVWRPCSNDAMRKMMEGTGVGKGLDIKGKSSKKGLLSALVPFMQIHNEQDKHRIQPISQKAKLRVYYSSQQGRQQAIDEFEEVLRNWENSSFRAASSAADTFASDESSTSGPASPKRLQRENSHSTARRRSKGTQRPKSPCVLDRYVSKGWYGLEISQRLFWEACVMNQDISQSADDGTATGRPSTPGFQDANLKTLKVACVRSGGNHDKDAASSNSVTLEEERDTRPIPVILQHDKETPMRPQTLVMAYEENGTVTPVVSDFDGFLLGWRREALWFGCNLPREQEDLMMWCIDQVEGVLDRQAQKQQDQHGNVAPESWTVQWLEILKKEANSGILPEIPEYGFGDPKSYGIMEQAAKRLIETGAVRHGSECFNYYFPQEIDEKFLVISDTLHPVPWRYVNITELQEILSQKIKEGFVFPLNPKWILCDPGWKKLYDELMESNALYADLSKDVWYPPTSGIRDRIEAIHKRHPNGFQDPSSRVSNKTTNASAPGKTCNAHKTGPAAPASSGSSTAASSSSDPVSEASSSGGSEDTNDSGLVSKETAPGVEPESLRDHFVDSSLISSNTVYNLAELELENFQYKAKRQKRREQFKWAQSARSILSLSDRSDPLEDISEGDEEDSQDVGAGDTLSPSPSIPPKRTKNAKKHALLQKRFASFYIPGRRNPNINGRSHFYSNLPNMNKNKKKQSVRDVAFYLDRSSDELRPTKQTGSAGTTEKSLFPSWKAARA